MNAELKPCPFCGGEAAYYYDCDMVKVRCSAYGCQASWFDESEDAADKWNKRFISKYWYKCSEQLPAEDSRYFGWFSAGRVISVTWYNSLGGIKLGKCITAYEVNHWMPLPDVPE